MSREPKIVGASVFGSTVVVAETVPTATFTEAHGTYKGNGTDALGEPLCGKTACLQLFSSRLVRAQFDDTSTGMGYGWFPYPRDDWEIRMRPVE